MLEGEQTSAHQLRDESDVTWTTDDLTQVITDEETTLLEYWLTHAENYVWALTRQGVNSFVLPPASTLEPLVQRVQRAFNSRAESRAEAERTAAEFSRVMLGPVKRTLRK